MTNWLITKHALQSRRHRSRGRRKRRQLGQRRHHLRRRLFPGRIALAGSDRYAAKPQFSRSTKSAPHPHVAGADDVRVAVLEDYLLDRALHELNIPADLLIFPAKATRSIKSWHGKIKVAKS